MLVFVKLSPVVYVTFWCSRPFWSITYDETKKSLYWT